jgi:hypothetical protein
MKLLRGGSLLRLVGHPDRTDDGEPTTLPFGIPEGKSQK